jgi:MFS family permease
MDKPFMMNAIDPLLKNLANAYTRLYKLSIGSTLVLFSGLLCLTLYGSIQHNWPVFLFFSVIFGIWVYILGRLLSCARLLRATVKNPLIKISLFQKSLLLLQMRKEVKLTALSSGLIFFCSFLFLSLDSGQMTHNFLDNFIELMIFSSMCGVVFFIIIATLLVFFTHHPIFVFQEEKQEGQAFIHPTSLSENEENQPPEILKPSYDPLHWSNDPMNPASSQYQSTYQHWNDPDPD